MAATLPHRLLQPFGVEIERDLSQPLDACEAGHLVELFREHGLILARGQVLSMGRQRELCRLLGPILEREGETGTLSNLAGGPSAVELAWHADAAYTEHPFDALSLHAIDVVDKASSTLFVSAEQGWLRLPSRLQDSLRAGEQEMVSPHYSQLSGRACDRDNTEALKRSLRPTVVTNPHNGRACLWVSELQTARLCAAGVAGGRSVLHEVFDVLYEPRHQFEHRWRNGDLIIWDNIALQHMRGNLAQVGTRILQRVIVGTKGAAPHLG
ncbi:taurine dioxygenase [Novosphingobium chloroacetimidivorans]|uniref:Taurine dioxygenase n=1 Tax=Novosphingobium chloroacetimidivorans TaxID=1428314 RepID=A0A7W7K752_9SPHN|nr:TauD/TfdA family dioxygenase [Novosphingobium chloroacetimidivorans]MBB4856843.1 taurine dioxygenase [Novosphingobium chloroacetimidivorans]